MLLLFPSIRATYLIKHISPKCHSISYFPLQTQPFCLSSAPALWRTFPCCFEPPVHLKYTLHLSLNEKLPFNSVFLSVYLLVWDSNAAPHPVFHVLLWRSDPGATRLAEHLSAELHLYQSASASPEQDHCRSFPVHASMSVCVCVHHWLWCLRSSCDINSLVTVT